MADDNENFMADLDESIGSFIAEMIAPKTDQEIIDAYLSLQFRVIHQSNNFFLPQLYDLIAGREIINIRPEYQRRLRWPNKKKSQLIESLLLNVPIPPVFLFESEHARYEVMDGQQRLNSIHEFLANDFALVGLEKLDFLNGRRYSKLPPQVRRGLERSSISATILLQETKTGADPYLVRRFVFERLNTGGEPLNQQEVRNSLYRSFFNDLLVQLARNDDFCSAFEIPPYTEADEEWGYENPDRKKNKLYQTMGDCQLVLRFFSLLSDANISGSMSKMMDRCMEANLKATEAQLDRYKELFASTLRTAVAIFGDDVFRLPPDKSGRRRISAALYDAVCVSIARLPGMEEILIRRRDDIRGAVDVLVSAKLDLFTGRANTAASIRERQAEMSFVLKAASS